MGSPVAWPAGGLVISEVVAGVLVDTIVATGRRLGAQRLCLPAGIGGRSRVGCWFGTYQLTADPQVSLEHFNQRMDQIKGRSYVNR
jgi:hypothetical protein